MPHYVALRDGRFGALRMATIDEGPRAAPVALLLHGEPTWSYLYRHIIPRVTQAGFRAVAPDFIGFGRSDKLARRADYTYHAFVGWLREFVETLEPHAHHARVPGLGRPDRAERARAAAAALRGGARRQHAAAELRAAAARGGRLAGGDHRELGRLCGLHR